MNCECGIFVFEHPVASCYGHRHRQRFQVGGIDNLNSRQRKTCTADDQSARLQCCQHVGCNGELLILSTDVDNLGSCQYFPRTVSELQLGARTKVLELGTQQHTLLSLGKCRSRYLLPYFPRIGKHFLARPSRETFACNRLYRSVAARSLDSDLCQGVCLTRNHQSALGNPCCHFVGSHGVGSHAVADGNVKVCPRPVAASLVSESILDFRLRIGGSGIETDDIVLGNIRENCLELSNSVGVELDSGIIVVVP